MMNKFLAVILFLFLLLPMASQADDLSKVFIFSGYGGSAGQGPYQQIGEKFRQRGIEPVYVEIDWSTGSIVDYIEQARAFVSASEAGKIYFYGFSMGGLISLALSKEFSPKAVIVSSAAAFFKEDLEPLSWFSKKKWYNWRLFAFSDTVSIQELTTAINKSATKLFILYGTYEEKALVNRAKSMARSLNHSELIVMPNVGHGLSKANHISYVFEIISKL